MGDVPGNKWGWGGGGARDIAGCPGRYLFSPHPPPVPAGLELLFLFNQAGIVSSPDVIKGRVDGSQVMLTPIAQPFPPHSHCPC